MFEIIFGVVLLGLFLAFWFWHSPIRGKLTREEIDRYLGAAEKLPLPAGEMTASPRPPPRLGRSR